MKISKPKNKSIIKYHSRIEASTLEKIYYYRDTLKLSYDKIAKRLQSEGVKTYYAGSTWRAATIHTVVRDRMTMKQKNDLIANIIERSKPLYEKWNSAALTWNVLTDEEKVIIPFPRFADILSEQCIKPKVKRLVASVVKQSKHKKQFNLETASKHAEGFKKLVELRNSGMRFKNIVEQLNTNGYVTCHGKPWNFTRVYDAYYANK